LVVFNKDEFKLLNSALPDTNKEPLLVVLFKTQVALSAIVKLLNTVVLPNNIDVLLIFNGVGIDAKPLTLNVTYVVVPYDCIINI
jgi:hypothetical protein